MTRKTTRARGVHLPLYRNGVLIGSVSLDLKAVRTALNEHVAAKGDGHSAATEEAVRARLQERWPGLAEFIPLDLVWHLRTPSARETGPRGQRDIVTPPAPISDALQAANGRANLIAGLAALQHGLAQPITDVIPNAPLMIGPDDRRRQSGPGARVPTFTEYVALAQATGDPRALAAIERYLRRHQRPGQRRFDWPRILAIYDAVRTVLKAMKAQKAVDANDLATVRAEIDGDLDLKTLWEKPRPPLRDLAITITARWTGVEGTTLLKEIKKAARSGGPRHRK
mgnify:CR=1 FL=1